MKTGCGEAQMRKNSTLTTADLDNIVTENFAPDIKKLAHEIGANLDNPVALRAIGTHIIASYGHQGMRDVYSYVRIIYGGTKAINKAIGDVYSVDNVFKRKRTTKAEAVARHIAALVKLLENEPDTIVGPVLDNLAERINRARKLLG
jgi:hypothetical protein